MYKVIDGPGVAQVLNRLKTKLLRDILTDISVCRLEGWDFRTYLFELRDLINCIL